MKVLVDECVDWRLRRDIVGHEVKTARQMGWSAVKNGELLALAQREFDVFVTRNRNHSFQQHLSSFTIVVIVLRASSNRRADLRPLVPELLACIPNPVWRRLEDHRCPFDRLRTGIEAPPVMVRMARGQPLLAHLGLPTRARHGHRRSDSSSGPWAIYSKRLESGTGTDLQKRRRSRSPCARVNAPRREIGTFRHMNSPKYLRTVAIFTPLQPPRTAIEVSLAMR